MKRKLVKQGRNALTVTLPSEWTAKMGLKAGDEVDVNEFEGSLNVNAKKETQHKKIEFDATKIKSFRNQYISFFYHAGFDEVRIIYDDPKVLEVTNKKLNELMGYEIVESGKDYFIIRDISKVDQEEFDTILRRSFILLKSMAAECLGAIREQKYSRLKEIRQMEKTNNKFTDFCIRILNKKGYHDYKKTQFLYIVVREIERLCDNYKYICDLFKDKDDKSVKMSDETMRFFEKANNYFESFYELFYKFDEDRLNRFIDMKDKLVEEGYSAMNSRKNEEACLLHHLVNIVSQTFDLKGPYFEMNL